MALVTQAAIYAVGTGLFTFVSVGLYIWSIHTKRSRPYVWAWLLRIALAVLAFVSQLAKGATYSLALSGAQVVGGLLILGWIVAYHRQQLKGKLDRTDRLALLAAGAGIAVWSASGEPLFAIIGIILADACATVMGVKEALLRGRTESLGFWAMSFLSASLALLSGRSGTIAVLSYPFFSLANAAINIVVLLVRRLWRDAVKRLTKQAMAGSEPS